MCLHVNSLNSVWMIYVILLRGRLHVINHMNYCNSESNLGILTLKKNDKPKHLIQNKTCDQYCTECCL